MLYRTLVRRKLSSESTVFRQCCVSRYYKALLLLEIYTTEILKLIQTSWSLKKTKPCIHRKVAETQYIRQLRKMTVLYNFLDHPRDAFCVTWRYMGRSFCIQKVEWGCLRCSPLLWQYPPIPTKTRFFQNSNHGPRKIPNPSSHLSAPIPSTLKVTAGVHPPSPVPPTPLPPTILWFH